MRLTPLRLLVPVLLLATLAGCSTTRSCGSNTEYLQAVERPPLQLPPEITPTERISPLAIPAVDPNPSVLDPVPLCLDDPPRFFARKGAAADSAEEAVRALGGGLGGAQARRGGAGVLPEFQAPGEGGSAAFLEQRREQVASGRSPEARLDEVVVTPSGADRRVVTFVQRFGDGAVRKELTLVRDGAAWRIVAERTLEVL
jgi:hypothetical protein